MQSKNISSKINLAKTVSNAAVFCPVGFPIIRPVISWFYE